MMVRENWLCQSYQEPKRISGISFFNKIFLSRPWSDEFATFLIDSIALDDRQGHMRYTINKQNHVFLFQDMQ